VPSLKKAPADAPKRTGHFAVVGHPIAHSRSPQIFAALSRASGIPLTYERLELTPGQFKPAFAYARNGFDGWNVTAPHKVRALTFSDEVSADARIVGAANVVTFRDGRAYAANTDVGGVIALLRSGGIDPTGAVVTVFGAGGAARATVLALSKLNAQRVCIVNRTSERAEALIADLQASVGETTLYAGPPTRAPIVINATSDGAAIAFAAVAACAPDGWCIDLQYQPALTPFVEAAVAAGRNAVNGTPMLVAQALATFRLWFGDVPLARSIGAELAALVEAP